MATIKVKMICPTCGEEFLRSKSRMNNHPYCYNCKWADTTEKKRKIQEENKENDCNWVSESNEKRKKTCMEKYGVENVSQNKELSDKSGQTKKDKYGYIGHFQKKGVQPYIQELAHSKSAYQKKEKTCINKHGVKHHMKNKDIVKKLKETYKERTGYDNPMNDPEIKKKIIEKYKGIGRVPGYEYDNQHFDSSWELAFYIWLRDNNKKFIYHPSFTIEYLGNDDKNHVYCPDFLIEGEFYEIKGTQFFNESGEPYNMYTKTFWWEKYELLKKYNIKILRKEDITPYLKYVVDTYGKKYIASYKIDRILKKEKQ